MSGLKSHSHRAIEALHALESVRAAAFFFLPARRISCLALT